MAAGRHSNEEIHVESPNVRYTKDAIESKYTYATSSVEETANGYRVVPKETVYHFRTKTQVPKLGLMLVGWGGNNGTTVTAAILANRKKLSWETKRGVQKANYFGSLTQAATSSIGRDADGNEIFVPMKDLVPMVDPNDIVLDGWDISSMDLGNAMKRAQVLDVQLQQMLFKEMSAMKPRPSIFDVDFVAPNQEERADNIIHGTKWEKLQKIRADIRDFKAKSGVDKVIVLWTANTERFGDEEVGLNDTWANLEASIKANKSEISPSTMFAVASILEKCTYINGSPQNTFVPGVLELAEKEGVFIGGDDFKSGQTKIKSVLVDFLISAGIKPVSIVSYNHLGNNDGRNLSNARTFRSKEVSKSGVVEDMVASNRILYKEGEHPDHCIVIKYIPYVGDSKRAMDEYISEIMMGGTNTIAIHNTCEDSLLAAPLILDLAILAELCERISFRVGDDSQFQSMHSVLTILSILLKAPLVPPGTPIVNAFFKQRACLENILKACVGLPPDNNMMLEFKESRMAEWHVKNAPGVGKNGAMVKNGHSDGIAAKMVAVSSSNGASSNGVKKNGVKNNGFHADNGLVANGY